MKHIKNFKKTINGNTAIFEFGGNRNVTRAVITLKDALKGEKVAVHYVINGITSEPVFFGEVVLCDQKSVEIKAEQPAGATHICITVPEFEKNVLGVDIYEAKRENPINYYPKYFDTDLKENYFLDTVSVFTTPEGYSEYSVYTSIDGRDFELLARKHNTEPCDFESGDKYSANGKEARIIRVYIEYNTASLDALFDRVEFEGKPSGTEIKQRPLINIPKFCDSKYNISVDNKDAIDEVYGIIERRLGEKFKAWFDFEITTNPKGNGYDFFELSDKDGIIHIKGNNGVSLAMGLNFYLKYYLKVNISQVGDRVEMPETSVALGKTLFKETKARVRYAYNYCTLSYSMAFWGEKEWEAELDWLALNGVNAVLDTTAQEEVWRRFLGNIGYSHEEAVKYIAGPAYYAWAYMANLSGFGGPVHDSWFYERTELARKNHLKMRKLGMYPILQGYSGMVPNDIEEYYPDIDIIPQGTWCSFNRPTMLRTVSPDFKTFAKKFYKAQAEVYGDYSIYFATDPFHEGGKVADMSPREVASNVLEAMLENKSDAVWIIQSWEGNPKSELLVGLGDVKEGKKHALVLDLYAEKIPNYDKGCPDSVKYGYSKEFDSTPWIYCMLNNFGGRLGLHGHLDNLANWIPQVFNTCKYIAGIGITPEASFNNPVLYDFLFESVWRESADGEMKPIDLNIWIRDYAERRYGKRLNAIEEAWDILLKTVYKAELNNIGQGAPESKVNARPSFNDRPASSWGSYKISYDKKELERAAELLMSSYDELNSSEGYRYDLITLLQQVLSNRAQDVHTLMAEAFENKDLAEFDCRAEEFLNIADLMDEITAQSEFYMLGRWVEQAKELAKNADDFRKMLYELNAKSLITTWGAYKQCETGGLRDYSNRQWSGLIGDFYKRRWEVWLDDRKKELRGEDVPEKIEWFPFEWRWARENTVYPDKPLNSDLKELGKKILG